MKWKRILLLSSLILCAITAHASDYDDCILKGMKGVSSDAAARLVAKACRNKVDEAKRAAKEAQRERLTKVYGSELKGSEYELVKNTVEGHGAGYLSQTLRNTSSSNTLTAAKLTIKDGDYYDYKRSLDFDKLRKFSNSLPDKSIGIPVTAPSGVSSMNTEGWQPIPESPAIDTDRLEWESKRTHEYYYKLFLRPGKEIRLIFPNPPTKSFYSEITTALGREAKWTDAVSATSLRDTIKPVPRDSLE
jgi:hypothetical protein